MQLGARFRVQVREIQVRCYVFGNFGHVVKACAMTDCSGWKRNSSGNGPSVRGSNPAGLRHKWWAVQSQGPQS